jgi:hypothetical protein
MRTLFERGEVRVSNFSVAQMKLFRRVDAAFEILMSLRGCDSRGAPSPSTTRERRSTEMQIEIEHVELLDIVNVLRARAETFARLPAEGLALDVLQKGAC